MPFAGYYSSCDPGETEPYSIDFANQLVTADALSSVASVTLVSDQPGADPNASNWLVGSASISGSIVSQVVGGSIPNGLRPGVAYRLTFTVNTISGRVLSDWGFILCNAIT
jgi:hypothetical protein